MRAANHGHFHPFVRWVGGRAHTGASPLQRRPILEGNRISHTYVTADAPVHALADVSLALRQGEFALLLGPSGSGKSTLLAILSGMLRPTSGAVLALGQDPCRLHRLKAWYVDDPRRPACVAGGTAALSGRGRGGRQSRPSQHRADLRGRLPRRPALFQHETHGGRQPGRCGQEQGRRRSGRAALGRPDGGHHRPGRAARAPARHPAPRPQAGQRPARRQGAAARHRFRPGQVADCRQRHDAVRRRPRHAVAARKGKDAARLDLGEVAARRYPDLRALPPARRVRAVSFKIVADQIVAAHFALWIGVCAIFLAHVAAGVIQVMAAGCLRRRGEQWYMPQYIELSVPAQGLLTVILFGFWTAVTPAAIFNIQSLWLALLMLLLLTAPGLAGVVYRWPSPLRLLIYVACLCTWIRLAGGWSLLGTFRGAAFTLPWYIDATAYAGMLMLVAYHLERRRHQPV